MEPGAAFPGEVERDEADEDGYDYDEGEDGYYETGRESLLHNPYVLAAVAVFGAIVLAVIVVLMAGGGGGNGFPAATGTQNPMTPQVGAATVESISTSTVREGPGTEYDQLGTLPRGQKVSVTGRDQDAKWFQIIFPQNSTLRGWVPASALKTASLNIQAVGVVAATPITRPTFVAPTAVPQATQAPVETTPTAAATEPAGEAPDVAVSFSNSACTAGSPVNVVVRNVGQVTVTGRSLSVSVAVDGVIKGTQSVSLSQMAPGDSVTIATDQVLAPSRTTVAADLAGSPADVNKGNNVAECVVQGGGVTPTPVIATPVSTPAAPQPTNTPNIAIGTPITP